jgi:hypothetical protein
MLHEAIEKNRVFLRVCAVVVVLDGAMLLVSAISMAVTLVYSFEWPLIKPQQVHAVVGYVHGGVAMVLNVMMMFAMADFIRWVLDRSSKPGWMLRKVEITIYLYVVLRITYEIASICIIRSIDEPSWPWSSRWIGQMALTLCGQLFWMVPWVLFGMAAGKGVRLIGEAQAKGHEPSAVS